MDGELLDILESLEAEKGVNRGALTEAIESALASVYERHSGLSGKISFKIEPQTGRIQGFIEKEVVEVASDTDKEIVLSDAVKIDAKLKIGDSCSIEIPLKGFSRIAAQTAKQVVIQKIREVGAVAVFHEFENKKERILSGIVRRFEGRDVIVDVGRTEAVLPAREQIRGENFRAGDRVKGYVLDVRTSAASVTIVLSRTHPSFVRRLFELEVPEISSGDVEIKSVAREAGERSKVAVASKVEHIDPVGTCVGMGGVRIKNVIRELSGEKIDIVRWSEDIPAFITNALSPSKTLEIKMIGEESADVIVDDDQLSLAIGKRGQNVRLAAKLVGWKINVKALSRLKSEHFTEDLEKLSGIGVKMAWDIIQAGFTDFKSIAEADVKKLMEIQGVGEKKAAALKEMAGAK